MKKLLISFFLILTFFLFFDRILVYSQTPTPSSSSLIPFMPGVDCGNSEGLTDEAKKCCKTPNIIPQDTGLIGRLKDFPLISFIIDPLNNLQTSVLQLQRKVNITPCVIGYPSDINDLNCTCLSAKNITPTPVEALKKLCSDYLSGSKEKGECDKCANNAGVWTSLGVCAYGDIGRFIQETVFSWGIGLAGIIALLCIIYAVFTLQTSGGNPEKIKKAQELLTSCIMGLMLIIFSIFILRLIGVDILKIPGFGK